MHREAVTANRRADANLTGEVRGLRGPDWLGAGRDLHGDGQGAVSESGRGSPCPSHGIT
jgi:hypothetical protein